MTYTLPERNKIIADIEEAEKQLNAEVRTACLTATTADLEAIHEVLLAAVAKVELEQKISF